MYCFRILDDIDLLLFGPTVNIYGWKRIGTGKNRGGYFHPSFVQGLPELCLLLKRTSIAEEKRKDDESCSAAPISQAENLMVNNNMVYRPEMRRGLVNRDGDQMFPPKNPLLGNMNAQIPREHFQVHKGTDSRQPNPIIEPLDPFGVRGLDSFGHTNYNSNRSTVPLTLIGRSGKLSEHMHLFADLFNPRDFQEDFGAGAHNNMMTPSREMFQDDLDPNSNGEATGAEAPGACENVFPQKLHFLLNQAEREGFDHIISWVNDGAAFKVHDSKAFLDRIMPNYFDQSKFESFRRQLNLYGFQRVSRGPSRGIYYHQFFLQSEPTLCQSITRPSTTPSPGPGIKC